MPNNSCIWWRHESQAKIWQNSAKFNQTTKKKIPSPSSKAQTFHGFTQRVMPYTKNLIIFFTHIELIIFHWFLFWPIIDVIFFYMLLIICHINKYQIFYTSKLFLSQMQNIINFKYEYETKSNKFSPYPNSNYTEKPF